MMTDALRQLAGEQIRMVLARFTRTPLSAMLTGTLATGVLQSSTATMVTTVSFVGAGLLTFAQALGIIYGASIGTTFTGWMIVLLGFKLQLSVMALPLLFIAAIARVFGRGWVARLAMALAGFSLLFLGIGMMQDGMAAFQDRLSPTLFPAATWGGRLQLVAIGIAVTLVTQSSTAGIAGVLVLLGNGALAFEQGAALTIGMHIGTAFTTSLLTSVGGSLEVRRTGVANVIYHIVTGLVALLLIDIAAQALAQGWLHEAPIALISFHTGFNILGAMLALPFTGAFARLIVRLMPSRADAPATDRLDPRLLSDPAAAIDIASKVLHDLADDLFAGLADALRPEGNEAALNNACARVDPALDVTQAFLARINIGDDGGGTLIRYDALLQQLDHLRRLHERATQTPRLRTIRKTEALRRHMALFAAILARHALHADTSEDYARKVRRLDRLARHLQWHEARARHIGRGQRQQPDQMALTNMFRQSDALRWMRRSANHARRLIEYQAISAPQPTAALASPADPQASL